MNDKLRREFEKQIMDDVKEVKRKYGNPSSRFLQMIDTHRGITQAVIESIMSKPASSAPEGYDSLWEKGDLGLTCEARVNEPKFMNLFEEFDRLDVVERARARLERCDYFKKKQKERAKA